MWARKLIDRMVAAEAPTPGPRTIPLRPAADSDGLCQGGAAGGCRRRRRLADGARAAAPARADRRRRTGARRAHPRAGPGRAAGRVAHAGARGAGALPKKACSKHCPAAASRCAFSETDICDAIELRGTLEGLAARLAAERGASTVVLAGLRDAVARIDDILAPPELSDAAFVAYGEQNARFHALLAEMPPAARWCSGRSSAWPRCPSPRPTAS
jgi:hypothetical protein